MKSRLLSIVLGAALLVGAGPAAADPKISREDFKTYLETQNAFKDERVQKMPEARRIPEIARRNFKLSGAALQAILDRVEAGGGAEGVSDAARRSIEEALAGTPLKGRIKEVSIDAGSSHVVAYIKWVGSPKRVEQEAVLVALKAGEATEIPSTLALWSVDEAGADLWRARIGADRTRNIREDRIEDWAKTRYVRLFEVEELPQSKKSAN